MNVDIYIYIYLRPQARLRAERSRGGEAALTASLPLRLGEHQSGISVLSPGMAASGSPVVGAAPSSCKPLAPMFLPLRLSRLYP